MKRLTRSFNLIFLATAWSLAPSALRADTKWHDVTMYFGSFDGGSGEYCTEQCQAYCTSFRLTGQHSRVLTNIGGIVDNDGFIVAGKLESLISAGVVPRTAHLVIQAGIPARPSSSGASGTSFGFSLNGKVSKSFKMNYDLVHRDDVSFEFDVPIEAVKFAAFKQPMSPGDALQPPDPVENVITFTHSFASGDIPSECGDHDGCWFNAKLEFDVVAPVVMIHGMGSDRNWFHKREFVKPFRDAGKPFIVLPISKKMNIDDGLVDDVAGEIVPDLSTIASAFGTDRLNVVGHSKGGLYGRALASLTAPYGQPGLFTLTTLDTPHEGSPMADYLVAYQAGLRKLLRQQGMLIDVIIYRLTHLGQRPDAYMDLAVQSMQTYNSTHKLPAEVTSGDPWSPRSSQIDYEAVASDAKNPQGGALDSEGYHGSIVAKKMYANYQKTKMIHFTYTSGIITGGTVEVPTGSVANDLVVPVSSQQYSTPPAGSPTFTSLPAGQVLFRNHSTVGKADVGTTVSQRLTVDRQNGLKK